MDNQVPINSDTVEGLKILLVEDGEVNTELAMDMLHMLGFTVEHANNGQQALELYDNSQHALILMDIEMPGIDGYETCRQLRHIESDQHKVPVPVIALTAYSATVCNKKCFACGMNDLLTKPFTISALRAILNKWLCLQTIATTETRGPDLDDTCVSDNYYNDKNESTILNHVALKSLKRRQDQDRHKSDLLTRIIHTYLEQSSRLLEELMSATPSADIETIKRVSHTLKSSSINVGADGLSELCRRIELQCNNGIIEKTLISQIYTDFPVVRDALNEILTSGGQEPVM